MAILNNSNAIGPSGYDVNNSVRLRSSASAYLSRTPASAGNRKTWTWSAWVKRGTLGANDTLWHCYGSATNTTYFLVRYETSGALYIGNASTNFCVTTQVFRDPSAWYHLVITLDTTQATATDRLKIYVNGIQVTTFSSDNRAAQIALNSDQGINQASVHTIGRENSGVFYLDGYLAEVNFVDGQALTPSSFGETDSTTGVWKPKAYTGTYGTNGFYLKFSDIATTSGSNAGLGKDFSGNANYWTTNNISVTAGTTYDAMTDVPTNTSATVANYCTLNPLRNTAASNGTFSNANLRVTGSNGAINCIAAGTMTVSGQMYWEITVTTIATASSSGVGIVLSSSNQIATAGGMSTGIYYLGNGNKRITGTSSAYGSSYTSGDVIGIAVDTSAETITFYKNNTSQGSISGTGVISLGVLPYIGMDDINSPSVTANFGQRPFSYTPPTGYKALNTFNLPTPTILQGNKYMDAVLWTGDGTLSRNITGLNFATDFVWLKSRGADSHKLYDIIRGAGNNKELESNTTVAEGGSNSDVYGYMSAFLSNGFTVAGGTDSGYPVGLVNQSGQGYVAWNWKANGAGVTNTQGSITSTVSVSTTAGFSIVTYTGTGSAATVGHGLGVAPKMVITKKRSTSGDEWVIWHTSLTSGTFILLFTTAAQFSSTQYTAVPSSTVLNLNTATAVNNNGSTYVSYVWAEIPGFSKFGSYTGNGSADGPFIATNFKPKYVMIKVTSTTNVWLLIDATRNPYNVANLNLNANDSSAENTASTGAWLDFTSNGFKIRNGSDSAINSNGATYVYACFASHPFKNSNAV